MDSTPKDKKQHTIFCRYSGMPLPAYADFPSLPVKLDAHLLMRMPFSTIIEEIERRKHLTDRQQRLLFVALLKQTDLVIFEHPALPSERTIETEFSRLIEIAYYIHTHRTFYTTFPKFKVTKDTSAISNINHVIDTWFDVKAKHSWTAQQRKELRELEAFEEIEQKVTKAILNRKPLSPTFNKHLIRWALAASYAPQEKRIKWAKIFLTKEDKLCRMCMGKKLLLNSMNSQMEKCPNCEGTGRVSDIDKLSFKSVSELRNYMVDSLPEETSYESSRKFAILRHLATKVQKIKQIHAAFGMELLSDVPLSPEEQSLGRTKVLEEPRKETFASPLDYLRALAKYRAAQDIVEVEPSKEEKDSYPEEEDFPDLDLEIDSEFGEESEGENNV